MDWVDYAVALNGKGVGLCNYGQEVMALEYFKGGLEVMSLVAMNCSDTGGAELLLRPSTCHLCQAVGGKHKGAAQHVNNENNSHYVYEKSLNFSASSSDVMDPGRISFCLAVLEFNVALCLHLQSNRLGDNILKNALRIYDCCLEHIRRSGYNADDESSQLLLFAALNNKSAILYELSSFQMARDVLGALSNAIQHCTKMESLSSIDDQDLEGFLFNVMLLKGVCIAPAA